MRVLMGERVVPIVAKIETKPAIEHIEGILDVTDALMVARGDLGVELPMEQIPAAAEGPAAGGARRRPAGDRGHPDAGVDDPRARPTRAEATDVANAVLDGADGDHALGGDRDR